MQCRKDTCHVKLKVQCCLIVFSSIDMVMKLPQQALHIALSLERVHYTAVGCGMIGILVVTPDCGGKQTFTLRPPTHQRITYIKLNHICTKRWRLHGSIDRCLDGTAICNLLSHLSSISRIHEATQ
jgi:hypothetical protein